MPTPDTRTPNAEKQKKLFKYGKEYWVQSTKHRTRSLYSSDKLLN